MKRKLLAMLVCVALVSTLFPFAAMAEETQVRYVAIGDSISSGYGLEVPETEAFPSLIAQDGGFFEFQKPERVLDATCTVFFTHHGWSLLCHPG